MAWPPSPWSPASPAWARPAWSRSSSATLPRRAVVLAGGAEPGSLGRPYEVVRNVLGGPLPAGDDVGRAVVDAIAARIGDRRALLVFEDLHWADAESVAVVEAPGHRTAAGHRCVVATSARRS